MHIYHEIALIVNLKDNAFKVLFSTERNTRFVQLFPFKFKFKFFQLMKLEVCKPNDKFSLNTFKKYLTSLTINGIELIPNLTFSPVAVTQGTLQLL